MWYSVCVTLTGWSPGYSCPSQCSGSQQRLLPCHVYSGHGGESAVRDQHGGCELPCAGESGQLYVHGSAHRYVSSHIQEHSVVSWKSEQQLLDSWCFRPPCECCDQKTWWEKLLTQSCFQHFNLFTTVVLNSSHIDPVFSCQNVNIVCLSDFVQFC